ncbi:ABC transporter ATP-binding protein [Clostridium luticellarii]|jgi:ATP-binding cassette subfamily B protein|uniref:ABC transporter ATP-binding protein n=1 Tax=Clostridium luticellarii TaxID=1691940 RepID=UPI002356E00A|nr:ABC transporter ATP-binding protein [Clostridium luticellarii]MCI1944021.1 ABC transporter ATP-binding protein/permease [Clostridium luticellarii]MCI1967337.1 ABC transporter ATP-binding protein/permease [Clostridium luticellarii]MCI1995528.1 ABC transporter ATP-binding protein/permease [Clostridium luticellarii]MCI2039177.1 ABC transporter ATP-binding protein/permease [Clostridium luticellarii]
MEKKFKYKNNVRMPLGPRRGVKGRGSIRPGEKPKNFKKTLLRLWKYFGGERKLLLLIFVFVILDSLISLLGPYFIGKSIDAMSGLKSMVDFHLLFTTILLLLFTYVLDGLLTFFQGWLMAGAAQRIIVELRKNLFSKLQKIPISFFDKNTHGEIMSRLTNDIENVSSTISQSTTQLMSAVVTVLGSFVMMLVLSPVLTFVSLITVPLVFLLTKAIAKNTSDLFKEQQTQLGKLNGNIEESISGIQVVKAFNRQQKIIDEFAEINDSLCRVGLKAQILSGFLMPLMNVINNIGFAAVAWVGGILAVKNIITVGIIASFLSYSRQFTRPLNSIASIFNTLQSAVAGAERVFDILDEKEELKDCPGAKVIQNARGHIVFENVCFGYRRDVEILKNINFEVKSGTSVALVGPTGAGKTTIVNLLNRFYDVSCGKIFLDGVDIRKYTRDSLRKCFGIVLQDTYLFTGTIFENIRYGRLDADYSQVKRVAESVGADKFIERLPKEYNTVLQEGGSNLSQGERQIISIARAVLSDPSILILDEATSNIDTRTEIGIQKAMRKLVKNRTSFIIAHRLSTIRYSDIIMVICDGKIVELGNHKELIDKKGVYYDMYYKQLIQPDL